jgi:hypothetical protein
MQRAGRVDHLAVAAGRLRRWCVSSAIGHG